MTEQTRNLLISLASHMAYMQGQLEARHELDDPEDYYWYRESVALRQKVTDALADGPAVPEDREPASVTQQSTNMPDWRGLCEELIEALETAGHRLRVIAPEAEQVLTWTGDAFAAAARASALLDQPEPEAVGPTDEELLAFVPQGSSESDFYLPNGLPSNWVDGDFIAPPEAIVAFARAVLARYGHQPAPSAAGEPSDKDCWQWYTYCPEEGLEMYFDREQAQSAAQSIMGSYEVAAHSDGWHEDMESVSWGMLVPVEQAQVVERKTADPDSEFDEWVKYELRPVRYGHQPAPAAEGEVRGLVEWLRDAAFDLNGSDPAKSMLTRAADLLSIAYATGPKVWEPIPLLPAQRRPTPVPVSERLPGVGDVEAKLRYCWWWNQEQDVWMYGDASHADHAVYTHWLPAHALPLPLPQGEAQQ